MDDVEVAIYSFLTSDPEILKLIQTKPQPPRMFPDTLPQNQPRDKQAIIYEVLSQKEGFALAHGPHGLPNAIILLECRGATRKQAKQLRTRVLESRGGNPDNRRLNGFAGNMGEGYSVQMVKVENSYYDFESPPKAGEVGIYIAAVELSLWWNNPDSLLTQ